MKRIFLGWDAPFLERTAELLLKDYAKANVQSLDLTHILLVLPVSRAMRRLTELLVDKADAQGKILLPPKMVTVGVLPEVFFPPDQELASDTEETFAWVDALLRTDAEKLGILFPRAFEKTDLSSWRLVAEHLKRIYSEISGAGLSFKDVMERASKHPHFRYEEQWEVLTSIHSAYAARLIELSLVDKHTSRARSLSRTPVTNFKELILAGTSDINNAIRRAIERAEVDTTCLIFAPEEKASYFDDAGCINAAQWAEERIAVDENALHFVEHLQDVGTEAGRIISELQNYGVSDLTIGVCSPEVLPGIEEELSMREIPSRLASGKEFTSTEAYLLLTELSKYVASESAEDFSAVIRQPKIFNYLREKLGSKFDEIFTAFDGYQTEHLQLLFNEKSPRSAHGLLEAARAELEELLGGLRKGPRPIPEWASEIRLFAVRLLGGSSFSRKDPASREFIDAIEAFSKVLEGFTRVDAAAFRTVGASDALRMLLDELRSAQIEPEPHASAVELLGWLELQMDDAPCLIIGGFQEGKVPESLNSDPFLPDSLRRHIGLLDNEKRYARDAYAFSSMLHSRQEIHVIAARKTREGDALHPSRLLFACDTRTLAARVKRFYESDEAPRRDSKRPHGEGFSIAKEPTGVPLIESMSVTSFKDYIDCPYRFYLKHVQALRSVESDHVEMDSLVFGSFTHRVLHGFAKSKAASSIDQNEIGDVLRELVDSEAKRTFGKNAFPSVYLQLAQLKSRLARFAVWQAGWARAGWKIHEAELGFGPEDCKLKLKSGSMGLRGRIDRIDHNEKDGRWAVFDYKTGEGGVTPEETHRKRGEWIDLQLPAYHHFLASKGQKGEYVLGFIRIGSDEKDIGASFADWDESSLTQAKERMTQVAGDVRGQKFWPPNEKPKRDDFPFLKSGDVIDEGEDL